MTGYFGWHLFSVLMVKISFLLSVLAGKWKMHYSVIVDILRWWTMVLLILSDVSLRFLSVSILHCTLLDVLRVWNFYWYYVVDLMHQWLIQVKFSFVLYKLGKLVISCGRLLIFYTLSLHACLGSWWLPNLSSGIFLCLLGAIFDYMWSYILCMVSWSLFYCFG